MIAGATYWFTKQREREAEWRREKLEHYKDFVASLSGNLLSGATPESQRAFARARNSIMLVAPQAVIEALHAFEKVIKVTNTNSDIERHDEFLSHLFYEIRRDLHISPSDDTNTFRVSLKVPEARRAE